MAISFQHKGTDYTLEFTRDSIKQMERVGFSLDTAASQPVTALETLFKYAFVAHHPRISQTVLKEIWDGMDDKNGLFEALIDLYNEPLEAMFEEPEEGKKIEWKVVK